MIYYARLFITNKESVKDILFFLLPLPNIMTTHRILEHKDTHEVALRGTDCIVEKLNG